MNIVGVLRRHLYEDASSAWAMCLYFSVISEWGELIDNLSQVSSHSHKVLVYTKLFLIITNGSGVLTFCLLVIVRKRRNWDLEEKERSRKQAKHIDAASFCHTEGRKKTCSELPYSGYKVNLELESHNTSGYES
jgi:hypothetical protein